MLKIFPILLFVSIAFSAEKTFFFLPPDTKSWFDSSPIIVENGDRQSFKEMLADTLHWFRYSWDEDSLPDSILIYRDSDSLFSEPIGTQGFPSEMVVQIPLKSLFEDSREGVISFIPEEEMRPDEDAYGFYTSDIRLRSYLGSFKSDLTVFVLVPDYKEWWMPKIRGMLGNWFRTILRLRAGFGFIFQRKNIALHGFICTRKTIRCEKRRLGKTVTLLAKRLCGRWAGEAKRIPFSLFPI